MGYTNNLGRIGPYFASGLLGLVIGTNTLYANDTFEKPIDKPVYSQLEHKLETKESTDKKHIFYLNKWVESLGDKYTKLDNKSKKDFIDYWSQNDNGKTESLMKIYIDSFTHFTDFYKNPKDCYFKLNKVEQKEVDTIDLTKMSEKQRSEYLLCLPWINAKKQKLELSDKLVINYLNKKFKEALSKEQISISNH